GRATGAPMAPRPMKPQRGAGRSLMGGSQLRVEVGVAGQAGLQRGAEALRVPAWQLRGGPLLRVGQPERIGVVADHAQQAVGGVAPLGVQELPAVAGQRSEERRAGKGGRSWGWASAEMKTAL